MGTEGVTVDTEVETEEVTGRLEVEARVDMEMATQVVICVDQKVVMFQDMAIDYALYDHRDASKDVLSAWLRFCGVNGQLIVLRSASNFYPVCAIETIETRN